MTLDQILTWDEAIKQKPMTIGIKAGISIASSLQKKWIVVSATVKYFPSFTQASAVCLCMEIFIPKDKQHVLSNWWNENSLY